jgi:hypothetical protein
MKTIWLATATGALLTSAAMAQAPATQPAAPPAEIRADGAAAAAAGPGQQVKADLLKAGFTDVTIMPGSFLVQAKDKSGNPVTMMIKPSSVTEVVTLGSSATTHAGGGASAFMAVPADERMGSKTVGLDVYNNANQDIGTIKDVAYSGSAIEAYIVGVGGFLGMGDHYVAVNPASVHISWDANSKTWHAAMDTTEDQLKAAPEFKYPSRS